MCDATTLQATPQQAAQVAETGYYSCCCDSGRSDGGATPSTSSDQSRSSSDKAEPGREKAEERVDEVSESSECDQDRVQTYLEEMNAASDKVNSTQAELAKMTREHTSLVRRWSVYSARMQRHLGATLVAEATPYYSQLRSCKAAQKSVEAAMRHYMAAIDEKRPHAELRKLERTHEMWLTQYAAAHSELTATSKEQKLSASVIEAVQPYFDAEDDHRSHMALLDAALQRTAERLDAARGRYRAALRGLEAMSEEAHARRRARAMH